MQKVKRFLFLLLILLCFFPGCEKEKTDYRLSYTGNFEITTFKNAISMCYDSSASCVDGWRIVRIDTTLVETFIKMFNEDRLEIKFGTGEIGRYNDSVYKEVFYPVISSDGELSLPEYPRGGHNFFEGYFIGFDTLLMNFHYGFGIGGYSEYQVTGIRK